MKLLGNLSRNILDDEDLHLTSFQEPFENVWPLRLSEYFYACKHTNKFAETLLLMFQRPQQTRVKNHDQKVLHRMLGEIFLNIMVLGYFGWNLIPIWYKVSRNFLEDEDQKI